MKKLTTTISYRVPKGLHCNHNNQKSTPFTRCRFCTDLGKHGFTCVLHNKPLSTMGTMISKCEECFCKKGVVEEAPVVPPKELMKHAIAEYRRIYETLVNQDIPAAIASRVAQEEAIK